MEIHYTRPTDVFLDRETVKACEDQHQLAEWLRDLNILDEEVKAHISARREFGSAPEGAITKLGFVRVATTWVTRRLRELNGDSNRVEDNQRVELARLHETLADQRREIARLREAKTDMRMVALVVHAAGDHVVVTESMARALSDLRLTRNEDATTGNVIFTTEIENAC